MILAGTTNAIFPNQPFELGITGWFCHISIVTFVHHPATAIYIESVTYK